MAPAWRTMLRMLRSLAQATVVGLLCCAGAVGCVEKPVVHVDHAEVRAASLQGVGLVVVLRITNPNSYDVQVRRVHASVTVANKYPMPEIDVAPNQWLPAHQTTFVQVPAFVPWAFVPGLIAESAGSPAIRYHVAGSADVTATRTFGVSEDGYPLDEEGWIPREVFVGAARSVMPF
jgi:LEA14-like dessication related protein